jgi:hypothetical protein
MTKPPDEKPSLDREYVKRAQAYGLAQVDAARAAARAEEAARQAGIVNSAPAPAPVKATKTSAARPKAATR